ncbi:MAG: TlpA family protein disulfide reductase [Robiginitomaculum sp.]|nr:TlpA family protein disulfide reductase [Robiginitomaculum sp.]
MSKPQNSNSVAKKPALIIRRLAIRVMLFIALLACIFVIVQSCSLEKRPNLQKFAKGGLKKLQVLETPPAQPIMTFKTADGQDISLSDFHGQTVLLNISATWCVPCVAEIPSLDELQAQRGNADFTVVTISMDRHIDDAKVFFKKANISTLNLYIDPTYSISSKVGVQAIPISIFYDQNGQEIVRIPGEVDWQSAETTALLDAILSNN